MRILFLSHYFPPEVNAPASRTYENCRRWVRNGHQVTVITCAPNCPNGVVYDGYRNRLWQREFIDGIEVVRVWTYIAANEGTVRRIVNYVSYMISAVIAALFVRRPDVVIATSPQFFCGWAGVLVSKLRRRPFILEIRDIWPESIVAVGAMRKSRLIRMLERMELMMYAAPRHIVTVGAGYSACLEKKNVPREKMSVVMNGVDAELFHPVEHTHGLREKYGLDGKFICTYCGTLGMAGGLDVVIRAARKLRERGDERFAFLLVGDGAERKRLEDEVARDGLASVVFTGRLDKKLIPEVLSTSDACLMHLHKSPLFETVMPSKFFEAAGMERPVINGVAGFAAGIVAEAGAGINIEPENEDELLAAVETLQSNPDMARTYAVSGKQFVAANFDRDTLAEEYLGIIMNVAEHARKEQRP